MCQRGTAVSDGHILYTMLCMQDWLLYIYILTFGSCACGVSLLSTGANIPLAQVVVYIYKANKKVSCKNIPKCRDGAASH